MAQHRMTLNLFVDWFSYHTVGWRMPGTPSDPREAYRVQAEMAKRAERAKLDAVFMGDVVRLDPAVAAHPMGHKLEPFSVLNAIAVETAEIGLIGTASTTYMEPYNLARLVSTLDHVSNGRAGWNIVTSFGGAENFGSDVVPHDERYNRAYEYMDVVTALWDSWADDAVVNDKAAGLWADTTRIHPINHEGKYLKVQGPFNIARSPQGWPVLVQAGASPAGMAFAAHYANMAFTVAGTLSGAQDFYRRIKDSTAKTGRDVDSLRVMPGIQPIVGETEAEAKRLAKELGDMIAIEDALKFFSYQMSYVDFTDLDPAKPIPMERLPLPETIEGDRGRYTQYYKWTQQGQTLGDLARAAAAGRGHLFTVGTAEQVADTMEQWFREGGCDGFQIQPPFVWDGLDRIIDQLIPELQKRGLAQKDYEGSTFRERIGIDRPAGR